MSNCIMCHAPLPPKRRKFCNDNCTSKYHTYHACGFNKPKPLDDKLSKKLQEKGLTYENITN